MAYPTTATMSIPKGTSKKKATIQSTEIMNQPPIGFSVEEPDVEGLGLEGLFFCKS